MKKTQDEIIVTGYVVDEKTIFTLTEIRQHFELDDDILDAMIEHGLIEVKAAPHESEIDMDSKTLQRIQTAVHLYHDLGVNIAGAALVLDVMDELSMARRELDILQRHLAMRNG